MSFLTILFILITLPFTLIRLVRWLAWIQQKEYRLDRFWNFLLSPEGMAEVVRLAPQKNDFTRVGLKRPAITIRSTTVGFISLILMGYLFSLGISFKSWWLPFLIYALIPLLPAISGLITEIIKSLISLVLLFFAQKKLQKDKPRIIGITGSYGKTATRHLCSNVISQKFTIYTPPKSHNTPLSIALDLLKHYHGEEILFLEFAAYKKGEIQKLASWFPPEISLITGLTPQHLALFGSLEKIIEAKGELVKNTQLTGVVLCNAMDPGTEKICNQDSSKKKINYSPEKVGLNKEKLDERGRLSVQWQDQVLKTNLIGLHHTETIAAAIVLGQTLEIPPEKIALVITSFVPEEVFTQSYFHPTSKALIINDGKTTNPKGFRSALNLLNHFKKQGKNTILITGGIIDLGDESESIHLDLARAAKPIVDFVFYTGSDGKAAFKEVFAQNMVDQSTIFAKLLPKFNQDDVILIEGYVPLNLAKLLQRNQDKQSD